MKEYIEYIFQIKEIIVLNELGYTYAKPRNLIIAIGAQNNKEAFNKFKEEYYKKRGDSRDSAEIKFLTTEVAYEIKHWKYPDQYYHPSIGPCYIPDESNLTVIFTKEYTAQEAFGEKKTVTAQYKVDFVEKLEGKDYKYQDQLGCTGNSIHECNEWLKLQYEHLKESDVDRRKGIFERIRANYDFTDWQTLYENGKVKYFEQLDLFETSQKED